MSTHKFQENTFDRLKVPYFRYRNKRTPRGRVARREKNWVHSNCVARREKLFPRTPQVGGVGFWPPRGLRDFRVARRERRISKVWKKFSGRATLILFCSRVREKSFSRRATRKHFLAYPSIRGYRFLGRHGVREKFLRGARREKFFAY